MTAPARPRRPAPPRSVVPAAPRLRAKARAERSARRRRRLHRTRSALLVLLPLASLAWLVLASPVLAVRGVEVTGTVRLTPDAVVAAAGVAEGTPLARVDVSEVADRVEAALLPAADVRVRRVWPSTVRLQVVERTAAVAVPQPGGVLLVDAGGVGFATEKAVPKGVPTLEVRRPSADDPATEAALAVLAELAPWLRGQLSVLRATSPSDVQLVVAGQRTVVWGAPGGAGTKAAALSTLLKTPGTWFDVSAPGIVVRR